jgi:Fe-S oxidoreductase
MVGEEFKCGGFKVKAGRIELNRQLAFRTFDEFAPADVIGVENCMRCGICSYSCPFWLTTKKATDVPAWRTYEVNKVYSMFYTGYGIVARFLRLRRLSSKEFKNWIDSAYDCTACGACTQTSPMEVPNWYTVLIMRRILHYSGYNLESAEKLAKNTKEVGNALGITNWQDVALKAGLPVDKKGSEALYVPSPIEVKRAEVLREVASVFSKLKLSVTVSSFISDPGYYAYFAGDFETARNVYFRVMEEAKKLGVNKVVATDGTAYFWLRWQGPKSAGVKPVVNVEHLTQTAYELYRKGAVKLEKADVKGPTTVHYSEFLSRLGGVEEPPRELLRLTVPQLVEPKEAPSSDKLYTCAHHLELISEKADVVRKARTYVIAQLTKWNAKNVVVFDPNCMTSLENAVNEKQADFSVTYYTTLLERGIKA